MLGVFEVVSYITQSKRMVPGGLVTEYTVWLIHITYTWLFPESCIIIAVVPFMYNCTSINFTYVDMYNRVS